MQPGPGNTMGFNKAFQEAGREVLQRFVADGSEDLAIEDVLKALANSVLTIEQAFTEYVSTRGKLV